MTPYYSDDAVTIYHGDCRDLIDGLEFDVIVTDPPYGLSFMNRHWDYDVPKVETWRAAFAILKPGGYLLAFSGTRTYHRMVCAIEDAGFEIRDQIQWIYGSGFPKSHNGEWGGTALKPAHEPIVMARKPLIGTVEANWREHGTGALNIDGCRIDGVKGTPASPRRADQGAAYGNLSNDPGTGSGWDPHVGRWPANLMHDGSDEVLAAFPQAPGQLRSVGPEHGDKPSVNVYGDMGARPHSPPRGDTGSAARFFYCAKASKADRGQGNVHPTVKPTDLMRYLCRLVTPAGGTVLDPFMGSGSTGRGAVLEGFKFIGIEQDPAYLEIARARIEEAQRGR